jgi:hypothetical protein
MAKISSYPSDANVTTSDRLIGSDNENSNETKNFGVGDIINLASSIILPQIGGTFVPYTGATSDVFLGTNEIYANAGYFPYVYATNINPNIGNPLIFIGGGGANGGVRIDTSANIYKFGDFDGNVNGTSIQIYDSQQYIQFIGGFLVSGNEGIVGQALISNGPGNTPFWGVPTPTYSTPYLSAHSSLQQNALGANTATPMYFHTTDLSSNVAIVSNSIITPVYAGVYNIQFSAQIQRTSGGSSATVDIWLRAGGVNVPNTNTSVNVQANAGYLVASWNFFINLDPEGANYDAQIMWATTDTNVILQQQASNAVHPATPSTILTVNKIHD